jgi:hypothetical protein
VNFTKEGTSNITATNITVVSENRIAGSIAIQKWTEPGAWNVVVTNPDGQSGILVNGFTVSAPLPAPLVSSITPSSGIQGTSVNITNLQGNNFITGAR